MTEREHCEKVAREWCAGEYDRARAKQHRVGGLAELTLDEESASLADLLARERAARAEAACAQMRAALESFSPGLKRHRTACHGCQICSALLLAEAALATDVGAGYVSPNAHAQVVAHNRVIAQTSIELDRRLAEVTNGLLERSAAESGLRTQYEDDLGDLRAQLAEVTAQATVMREALSFWEWTNSPGHAERVRAKVALATDAGKALAERVKLLELVAHEYRRYRNGYASGVLKVDDAMVALDAHDKNH